jgi:uncharacterized protein (TIGR02996 family)
VHDDNAFLCKLLENPADDTVRLVYADWLDERDDDESKTKAQFLRLTARLRERKRTAKWRAALRAEMQPLAAKLPTDWLAVVSRLVIDYCGAKLTAAQHYERLRNQFAFVCDVEWDEMTVTGEATVRHCERCKENVHYCDTITAAREHARQGHCVAVDLGIIRRDNDLAPRRSLRGRMLPAQAARVEQQEDERLAVDDVSREREERKRNEPEA